MPCYSVCRLSHVGPFRRRRSKKHKHGTDVSASEERVESLSAGIRVKLLLAENSNQLDLSDCQLGELPERLFELENLTELSLSGNSLHHIPREISRLTQLQRLQLSGNELRELPEEIGALKELRGVWIHGNFLETIPDSFGDLTALEKCSLSGNRLNSLPDSICKLASLAELEIAGNRLTQLPSLEGLENLKKLTAHGNRIQQLTESILFCLSLQILSLQGNSLKRISSPYCLFPQALKSLNLADNQLRVLECHVSNLTNLEQLTLYGNELEMLPDGLMDLPRLKGLWLESNPLSKDVVKLAIQKRPVHVGLDDQQQKWLDPGTEVSPMVTFSQIPNPYRMGYFKLVREDPGRQSEMLIVAFGSAPGTPNWASLLRKVKTGIQLTETDLELSTRQSIAELSYDILYVVDPRRSWYGIGTDSFSQYGETLKQICKAYRRCLMLGDSMGATAGLLFSDIATAVLAFCPQVYLKTASIRSAASPEEWEALTETITDRIAKSSASIKVVTGTWNHDMDQVKDLDREKVKHEVLLVDTHRLTAYLNKQKQLIPFVREEIQSVI